MNIEEFKAWLSRNVGRGGQRPSSDPYNKSKKGQERNPDAAEYFSKDIPEYHHYAENPDMRHDDEDEQEESSSSSQQKQSRNTRNTRNAGRAAQSVARQIIPKVVLVVAGSIVVVGGYNQMKAKEAQAAVTTTAWVWNENHTSATLQFINKDGKPVKEVPAVITTDEVAATCTGSGTLTYTAKVEDGKETYTDVYTVTLNPLGHDFGEGKVVTIDGKDAIDYECNRCHEHFVIVIDPTEDDPTIPDYLAKWTWNEDHSACEVELADANGNLVTTAPATVTTKITQPTCVKEGATIYQASYTYEEFEYKTTESVAIDALGHDFDEGNETIIDGKPSIVYECSRCGEKFIITIDVEEETSFASLLLEHMHEHEHHHAHSIC